MATAISWWRATVVCSPFYGSLGGRPDLTALHPVVGIAAGPAGDWYVLARSDGSLFPFGPGAPSWIPAASTAPAPGNPGGGAAVPAEALPVDTSRPTRVVGTGTPASCTSDAVVDAVTRGGIVTFDCGPAPVTITLDRTIRIPNDGARDIVVFHGKLDPAKLNLIERAAIRMVKAPLGDYRDWDAIYEWALGIKAALKALVPDS